MSTSLKVDVSGLKRLAQKINSPELRNEVINVASEKPVAALISQAIADNFAKEGPGWAPLKARTIRQSVSKKLRTGMKGLTDKEVLHHEKISRGGGEDPSFRKILQRTRLLYKSVTTPGYSGSNKTGVSGSNIYKVEGSKIIWGTSLVYARAQNKGNPKNKVPAREFLVVRDEWMSRITKYVLKRYQEIIKKSVGTKTT